MSPLPPSRDGQAYPIESMDHRSESALETTLYADRGRIDRQKKAVRTLMFQIPEHRRRDFLNRLKEDIRRTPERVDGLTTKMWPISSALSGHRLHLSIIMALSLGATLTPLALGNQPTPLDPFAIRGFLVAGVLAILATGTVSALQYRHDRKNKQHTHQDEHPSIIIVAINELLMEMQKGTQ